MRLFSALPLSPPVIERLLGLRLRLSAPGDGLRWSTPEQWHITLQFYGDVDEVRAQHLAAELAKLSTPAPELVLEGLATFAAKGILFASVAPSPMLVGLHTEVLQAGQRCGLVPESRPFHPHITLARSKGLKGHAALKRLASPGLPSLGPAVHWRSAECLLLESKLSTEGSIYSVRSHIPLWMPTGSALESA